jgi:hypothetical protein
MNGTKWRADAEGHEATPAPPLPGAAEAEEPRAWEMVESGRYMPRRIRGSYRGRELG